MQIWDCNMEGLEGLKGLTAQDRENWEKEYSSKIKGFTPDQTERMYRNFKFKEKFGNREDYNSLKSLPPEKRDSLYNAGFETKPEIQPLDTRDEEQKKVEEIGKAFQQGQQFEEQSTKMTELYNKWPATARRAVDEFDKIADTVSPYYKKYKNTEYLPFSDEEKYQLAADYNAAKAAYGEEEANNMLRRKMQNTASKNQSVWEKFWNGFKGMGAQTAGALIGAAGMIKGAIDYVGDERNENIDNAAIDFFDHVVDNDWTRYGNDVMQYGSLFDANIQEAKQQGGLSNTPVIRTTGEEQGSILDNLLSVNTIPELITQQGFTIASMLTGAGLSSITNKAFQGAKWATMAANRANALGNLERVNAVLKGLQQAQQKFSAFAIPAMVGTVEGVSEGLNTKIQFLDDAKQMVAETQAKAVNDEFNRRLQNPEELSKQGYNPQSKEDLERLYKEIYDSYAPQYEESIKKAEANAAKAGVYNMGLNSMINGALNMTLKAGLQTPSVQEAMRRSRLGRLFNPREFRVNESGRVTPSYGKMKQVLNVLQEPAGEFAEEYLQSVSDAFARGGAEYNLQNFITNKYKGDGKNAVDESIANDLFAATKAAGDALTDKETILSGIYGALASGMGTPTINNRRGPAIRRENESNLSYNLRRSPITYRNPIYEAIQEQREAAEDRATTAQVITDWLQDPANKAKYDGLVGTFNWAKAMDDSSSKNDEFSYRNSELGKTINDVMVLEKLKGTDYYMSFMNDLTRAANAEEGSPEAQALIQQFKNAPNNRDIQQDDATILATIKKNSNKLLDTMSKITTESESIDKMLGNAADEDTKQALIYGKLSVDNWRERATQLEDEINGLQVNPTATSNLSDRQKEAVVNYGSISKANEEHSKLTERIDELKKDIDNIKSRKNLKINEQSALRSKEIILKTLQKQAKRVTNIEEVEGSPILSESEIMSLNPADRATILNPENKSKYSEEQQAIIDNVIREGTAKYNDFVDKIQDAGRLNIAQRAYLTQYNSILSNPSSFNAFTNRIKQQVADDNTRKKYEFMNGTQDYATFVKDLDKAYRESDSRERAVIRNILKDNPNYKRYIEDNKNLEGMFDQLETNEKFSQLDENDRNLLMTSMQFLVDRGVSPTDAVAMETLASQDENGSPALLNYINEVNGRLPEGMQLTPSSVGEIIQTFKDVLGEYTKNTTDAEKINKPVEVAPTTTEDSKPPVDVKPKYTGVFANAATSTEENNARLAKTASDEMPASATPEANLVDKFKTNSNEAVANAASIGVSTINSASEIYNDVKEQATQILDELGDSEYEDANALSEAIIAKANQLQVQSQQGGDNADKASSLLKQVAAKMKVKSETTPTETKKERAATPDITVEERRNNGLINTAEVERHPESTVAQASKNFGIMDYLRKGTITPKTQISFIADPAIIAGVKQEMGEVYNEEDHLPIMAVVEDSNGPITIGDKKYQPIGFMPRTSANTQGAARMEPIRRLALTQQDGQLIKGEDGNVITTNGYVRANPPEHTKAGTPNTPIHQIMRNDMEEADRTRMDDDKLPMQERQSIYRKAKDKILSKIKRIAQDANGERIHLSYVTPNMKGGETEFELYVTSPQNSTTRAGQPMAQVLNEGTPEDIIKANSRTYRFTKTLEDFFKKKPFGDDIRFKREGNELIAVGDGATKLNTLGENLTKKLSNFITVPKGYEYKLTPTETMVAGERMYQLSLTNGTNTIPLANVFNGTMTDPTKANVIKALMLDNGNFRQEGNQPFAKWQVNYNDFNAKEGESEEARKARLNNANDIFDDNILDSSRTSFKYSIRGVDINSPFKQQASSQQAPSPTVANQVNATQGKPINTPVVTATDQVKVGKALVDSETGATLKGEVKPVNPIAEKAKTIASQIVEDSKNIRLADDNSGYVDNNGVRYARVTSIIQADENAGERFDSNSPWITPSTNIGTSVDEFVRDFFAGEFFDENGKIAADYYYDYPNASQEQWKAFANQLSGLKNYIDSKGLTVIPRDVTVTGAIKVTDTQGQQHEIPVAGTLDLLAYDEQGNFHIFDMKTNRSGISDEKKAKYAKQVSMYQKFLEDKYGVKVASLNIIPINVSYPTPFGFRDGKTKYEVSEGNQLLANGKEYKEAKPTLEEVGSVPYTDVNIQYDKLTNSEKQMITDMLPEGVKPTKTEVEDGKPAVNKNLGLKMGKVKNRFAKPAKKTNLVNPSNNNWESLSDNIKQSAISMGYTKESWNEMSEEEKQHQKECLG